MLISEENTQYYNRDVRFADWNFLFSKNVSRSKIKIFSFDPHGDFKGTAFSVGMVIRVGDLGQEFYV
jgi:hypothetical protein